MMTTMMIMIKNKRLTEPNHFSQMQNPHATMEVNKYEMQTMQKEQSGLPDTSYDDKYTFVWGGLYSSRVINRRFLKEQEEFITNRFPRVDFAKLGPISFSKKPANVDTTIVSFGTKGGETEIFRKDGERSSQKIQRQVQNTPWSRC